MTEQVKAFLRIEKLVTGKVLGYEIWQEIPIDKDTILIGRSTSSPSSRLPDIKIIGDDYITRREHVEIFHSNENSSFMIRDNKSMNGSYLNERILEKNKAYPLKDRDIIGLAKINGEIRVKFRFRLNDETPPPWADDDIRQSTAEKGLHINLASKKVFVNGHEVSLTKTELKLLEVLYENKGNACSIDDIAWQIWGETGASDELIAQHIRRLRAKIEADPSKPRYIITVPGKHGCYRLDM
jgi:pSer/pThr/pTyr-binding forkhead associated (FHA) protein